ncbi:transcriptional regulator ATRX homolog [Selaginella moellendorffii]|uniref:transcriptional regulator ATRX homolog n=1 Tax=Selaginella moellendorffii TaxID=88036 RepID=UPI000D1CE54F|nr:transcriptional regulator ATRX homolog [Selaginella moellendorffii]|eukprot:XP_024530977.1 transcriptional regulator ATRX homolog [Selaginella moellendorffii]
MAMAAMAEAAAAAMEAEKSEKERNGELELDLTQRVESAVTARATYIKEHAESLTMVSFRRLLEEDLGLETTALDPHKKKIKELVDHIMNADDPEVTEAVIRDALAKRSSYLKTDSRNMKLERVRRLLEEDLGLQNFALDTKKELVKSLLDEVLNTSDVTKEEEHSASEVEALETETGTAAEVNEEKKRKLQSAEKSRKKKRLVKKLEETDESEREDSEENKPRKRKSGKKKAIVKDSEDEDEDERKSSNPKSSKDEVHAKKPEETEAEDTKEYNTDSDESPAKKTPKKKAAKAPESKPVVSKVVEQLKQMIKASGINIPPSVYKRVKQVPESKRESSLIKELESILQKEGLNRNSSEKELKAVRKKKDKQKDLEGIDVGNIITEGRGRRQANLFYEPLPFAKKKRNKTVLSDDEESSKSEEEKKQGGE